MTMAKCCGSPPCSRLRSSSARVASSLRRPLLALSAARRSIRILPASGNRTAPSSPSARDRPRRCVAQRPRSAPTQLHARLRAGQNCPPSIAAPPGIKAAWQARGAAESPVTEASIVIDAKSSGDARHWRLPRRGPRLEARAAPVSQTCRPGRCRACTLGTARSAHGCAIEKGQSADATLRAYRSSS